MKAEMSKSEALDLLDRAEEANPDSRFVESVRDWFEEHGFITERQAETLEAIVDEDDW